MNTCKKCGAPLLAGSKFCGRCGTGVDAPIKRICPTCRSEVMEGAVFCNKCGARLTPPVVAHAGRDTRTRTLVVSCDSRFGCFAKKYKVIINGNLLGSAAAGKEFHTRVASDIVTIEIVDDTAMSNVQRRLTLRVGQNPHVSFKLQRPGTIVETVSDAQVLERR